MWKPLTYVDYEYTKFGNSVGWLLALSSMVWVPAYFIYYVITCEKKHTSWRMVSGCTLSMNHMGIECIVLRVNT